MSRSQDNDTWKVVKPSGKAQKGKLNYHQSIIKMYSCWICCWAQTHCHLHIDHIGFCVKAGSMCSEKWCKKLVRLPGHDTGSTPLKFEASKVLQMDPGWVGWTKISYSSLTVFDSCIMQPFPFLGLWCLWFKHGGCGYDYSMLLYRIYFCPFSAHLNLVSPFLVFSAVFIPQPFQASSWCSKFYLQSRICVANASAWDWCGFDS